VHLRFEIFSTRLIPCFTLIFRVRSISRRRLRTLFASNSPSNNIESVHSKSLAYDFTCLVPGVILECIAPNIPSPVTVHLQMHSRNLQPLSGSYNHSYSIQPSIRYRTTSRLHVLKTLLHSRTVAHPSTPLRLTQPNTSHCARAVGDAVRRSPCLAQR
jgi:hypothetical protein